MNSASIHWQVVKLYDLQKKGGVNEEFFLGIKIREDNIIDTISILFEYKYSEITTLSKGSNQSDHEPMNEILKFGGFFLEKK